MADEIIKQLNLSDDIIHSLRQEAEREGEILKNIYIGGPHHGKTMYRDTSYCDNLEEDEGSEIVVYISTGRELEVSAIGGFPRIRYRIFKFYDKEKENGR